MKRCSTSSPTCEPANKKTAMAPTTAKPPMQGQQGAAKEGTLKDVKIERPETPQVAAVNPTNSGNANPRAVHPIHPTVPTAAMPRSNGIPPVGVPPGYYPEQQFAGYQYPPGNQQYGYVPPAAPYVYPPTGYPPAPPMWNFGHTFPLGHPYEMLMAQIQFPNMFDSTMFPPIPPPIDFLPVALESITKNFCLHYIQHCRKVWEHLRMKCLERTRQNGGNIN